MPTIQQLKERRANAWSQMQETLAAAEREGRDLSAEEREKWDNGEADVAALSGDIGRLERSADLDSELRSVQTDPAVVPPAEPTVEERSASYDTAFRSFLRGGVATLEREERQVLSSGFVSGTELRAQGVATSAGGGYFVPQGFRQRVVETMKDYGAVRDVAEVISTETGNTLPWPTNDDTANKGAILAENTQVTEQDVTLGTADLGAYMYTSKLVRVSLQLLQDSAFDFDTWLARKLGQRLGRITNEHYTTGTGTAQPLGIQTNAVAGVTLATGNTTSITYDGLVDLIHSIDPAYRRNAAGFMLRDATLSTIRKLKDSQNRPLWEPSIQAGVPDTLLGYRVIVNQDMPAAAASVKSVLFGDFRAGYVIRDVLGIQLLRLEERYADFLQVGFLSFLRTDAEVQDSSAYKALVQSAT